MPYYPTDEPGRLQLADELLQMGYQPTQDRRDFILDKLELMAVDMANGTFDWFSSGLEPIVLGPKGEIIGGHHRIVAAHLANIDVMAIPGPRPQAYSVAVCYRPVRDWPDVLPKTD